MWLYHSRLFILSHRWWANKMRVVLIIVSGQFHIWLVTIFLYRVQVQVPIIPMHESRCVHSFFVIVWQVSSVQKAPSPTASVFSVLRTVAILQLYGLFSKLCLWPTCWAGVGLELTLIWYTVHVMLLCFQVQIVIQYKPTMSNSQGY